MKIAIASDHVGLELKQGIINYFNDIGVEYHDFGTFTSQRCNYPEFALKAALAVTSGEFEKGLLFCGTGVGISIAANKVKGIRCVVCSEPYSASLSRRHNDTNMLAIGSRVVGLDLAIMIVQSWLSEKFEGGRHSVRVEQISQIESFGEITSLK